MKIADALATGSSTVFRQPNGAAASKVFVSGAFGTATVQLQAKDPDGVWVPVDGATDITSPVMTTLENQFPEQLRYALLTPDGATSITISVEGNVITS